MGKSFPHPVPQFPQMQPQGVGYKKAPDVQGDINITAMAKWELNALGRRTVAVLLWSPCCYGPLGIFRLGILWPTQAQGRFKIPGMRMIPAPG